MQNKKQASAPIYSKIEYINAIFAKKTILMAEIDLLNSVKTISDYKELRKQELMLKLKIRNNLAEIKNRLTRIIDNSPRTEGIEKALKSHPIKINFEIKKKNDLSNQLIEIKNKLDAM